jgi:hypothetical protein
MKPHGKSFLKQYKILEKIEKHSVFEITSSQINEFREARLMTKFDHRKNLPEIFKKNKLSILPITRGSYLIARSLKLTKILMKEILKYCKSSISSHYIESIDYENITSESTALSCAYVSGIISDFVEDEEIVPTVSRSNELRSLQFLISTPIKRHPFQGGCLPIHK